MSSVSNSTLPIVQHYPLNCFTVSAHLGVFNLVLSAVLRPSWRCPALVYLLCVNENEVSIFQLRNVVVVVNHFQGMVCLPHHRPKACNPPHVTELIMTGLGKDRNSYGHTHVKATLSGGLKGEKGVSAGTRGSHKHDIIWERSRLPCWESVSLTFCPSLSPYTCDICIWFKKRTLEHAMSLQRKRKRVVWFIVLFGALEN